MSRKQYPMELEWEKTSTDRYFLMAGMKCGTCDHVLGEDEIFWRREKQVSYMRGDDEVEIKCANCMSREPSK
jgi:hypothetical protein